MTTINFFKEKNEKNGQCLALLDLARKLMENSFSVPPHSRHVRQKISAHVDWGLSRWSRVHRPGTEDPHRRERKLFAVFYPSNIMSL
jgi:hypothetical protein